MSAGDIFSSLIAKIMKAAPPMLEKRLDVAVAEPRSSLGLFVEGDKGVRLGVKGEAFVFLKFQNEVVVPDAGVFKPQIIFHRPTNAKRKMADDPKFARHFAGKDAELNHQNKRRVTSIWSPG